MGPNHYLAALGLVASGFLRILAAYLLFVVVARVTWRPQVRHVLWLLFLIGAGFYWATLLAQMLKPLPFSHSATRSVVASEPAARSSATTRVTIPSAWDDRLEAASRTLNWAYVGGLIIMLARLARRRRFFRQAVASAQPVSSGLNRTFEEVCSRLGVSQCRIVELPGLPSPATAYVWRPLVLIPEGLDSYLNSEQLIDVLYHELIHIRRLDFLWGTLGEIVGSLLFFHPAIWSALRNLGRERELACDGAVIKLRHGRRTDYASCLARLARRRVLGRQLEPPSHLALLNSFLALRVQTLLAENRRHSRWKQSGAILAGLLALFVFVAVWSPLSLSLELATPLVASAPLVIQDGHSTASREFGAHRRKPYLRPRANIAPVNGLSTEVRQPLPHAPASAGIPLEAGEMGSLPTADSVNHDAWIVSPQVKPGGSPREAHDGPVWDETPPSKTVHNQISKRRTIIGAAVGVLWRVAAASKGQGGESDSGQNQSGPQFRQ
jgi:beta-lactamase regulating signal transducer with metallopeptidase domain